MPGDHARDRFAAGVAIADPDADAVAYPQSLAMACVVDRDLDRSHGDKLARLPRPREVPLRVPPEPTGEDSLFPMADRIEVVVVAGDQAGSRSAESSHRRALRTSCWRRAGGGTLAAAVGQLRYWN